VRRKLTKEEIDCMLSIPEHRKPFPMVADWFLARIHDPAERARYMGWADVYYKSQEQIKREQQYVREELKTLGYVKQDRDRGITGVTVCPLAARFRVWASVAASSSVGEDGDYATALSLLA
jgi:hypothetical protein